MKSRMIQWMAALLCLWAWRAAGDLQAIVVPGYQFSSSERVDASKLNRLGRPTITITGTVGGTNASIGAGSIQGAHLGGSVVDNVTTWLNASNAIAIATNAAGPGLIGGGYAPLEVNPDGVHLILSGDAVTLASGAVWPTNVAYRVITNTAAEVTIDWTASYTHAIELNTNVTVTFSGAADGQSIIVVVTQGASGTNTITWPAVRWRGGSAPTQTQSAGKADVYSFLKAAGEYYGTVSQNH